MNDIFLQSATGLSRLPEAAQQSILGGLNPSERDDFRAQGVHHLFEEQARRAPDAIAVEVLSPALSQEREGEPRHLTYRQLNERANQLANFLIGKGVGPETLVGICVERSLDMIIGLLATFKAGAAYLPIDPAYPHERQVFMLEDSQVSVLLTQSLLKDSLPAVQARIFCLDADWPLAAQFSGQNPNLPLRPNYLAYVIYTSGSTGRPKGVQIEHAGISNVAQVQMAMFKQYQGKRILQFSSFSFDAATFEIIMALCAGATLCLTESKTLLVGSDLLHVLQNYHITTVTLPPSTLATLPDADLPSLETLIVAGEACSAGLVSRWAQGRSFFNLYGPTETAIWGTAFQCIPGDQAPPVGKPIPNVTAYILDHNLNPVPAGEPGELYLGGVGVARGYLNCAALTSQKFIPNPFEKNYKNHRLFKTGDLACFASDGNIKFLGRIDDQVKIRGFRVELGEIQTTLSQHPQIKQVVVVAREERQKQVVAYLVPLNDQPPTPTELSQFAKKYLPDYMLPAAYVALKFFPLTPNGKIDQNALPVPDFVALHETSFTPARSMAEERLAAIWSKVLEIAPISVTANFFELGGHSINAVQILTFIREQLSVDISLQTLFKATTIAELAMHLNEGVPSTTLLPKAVPHPEDHYQPFPLTEVQQAYWLGRSDIFELGRVATHVYIELDYHHPIDLMALNTAWQRLIQRHEMLRMVMVDGRQKILAETPVYEIACLDLTSENPEAVTGRLNAIREEMSHQTLATDHWPLFDLRATCWEDRMRLHLSFDILILDANSLAILFREWLQLYENPDAPLPALELSFRDYVLAENTLKDTEAYQRSAAYWFDRLDRFPSAPALPLARSPREVLPRFERRQFLLEADQWQTLKKRGVQAGLTPSCLILAAFSEVLATWSRNPAFAINLTLFNRLPLHAQVNDIVGDFTSLTLLEIDNRVGDNFAVRAQHIQRQLWQDLDHRYVSGVAVLRRLAQRQGNLGQAIMPVVFTSALAVDVNDIKLLGGEMAYIITQTPQVWIDHQIFEEGGGLLLTWDAVESLFPAGLLDDMFGSYCQYVTRLACDDRAWSESRPHLMPAGQLAQRAAVNQVKAPLSDALLHSLFLQQVKRHAARPAVLSDARVLTYSELYERANSLGHWLRQNGATPNILVAIVMEKGWEQVVAALGILMAGAAYLPIDSDLPAERQHYLLEQGQVKIALTQSKLESRLNWPNSVRRLSIDTAELPAAEPLDPIQKPQDIAYVIYTSGSTGLPKGVVIDHRGAVNTLLDINRRFGITQDDRVLALSALNFDLSVYDIFGILAAGGAMVMANTQGRRDPSQWAKLMADHQVTLWNTVPALMQMLLEYQAERPLNAPLKRVLMSGDWIPPDLPGRIKSLWPDTRIYSLGGATEASIWSIAYPIEKIDPSWKSIPYGKPLTNQSLHVFNALFQPCPVWTPGDLYIGGIGLAKGYWRDPEKTKASFVNHPHTGEPLYKTGDLGRYLPDGNIEFLGREDFQVKIRGHRIELGEIEANLLKHPSIKSAVVAAVGEHLTDKHLVAYVVSYAHRGGHDLHKDSQEIDQAVYRLEAMKGILTDPVERMAFKLKQPGMISFGSSDKLIELPRPEMEECRYVRRQSYRQFLAQTVSLEQLSQLLACLSPRRFDISPLPKYRYASAGSLYPVQTYLYVKPDKVAGLRGGTYYYHPAHHRLALISGQARIARDVHGGTNREIFDRSAFSLFFIGELAAIEPMYGSLSRDFCLLEAGYMSQLLMEESPPLLIGLCPIGGLAFDPLRPLFNLKESQILLHSFIGGGLLVEQTLALPQPAKVETEANLAKNLRVFLRDRLPDHMVPEHYMFLEALPLTANGKVDRKALPKQDLSRRKAEIDGPEGEWEEALFEIVKTILELEEMSVTDNFFSLGANSMHIVQIYNRVQEKLGANLSLNDIFLNPSVRSLAGRLSQTMDKPSSPNAEKPASAAVLSNDLDAADIERLLANVDQMDEDHLDALLSALSNHKN